MLESAQIRPVVVAALAEDAPSGDVTSQVFVPAEAVATADVVAREPGVMAGVQVLEVVFAEVDPAVEVVLHIDDAQEFAAGDVLATISGPARAILRGERIALNLLQRMSGIATFTAEHVAAVAHTRARVVDTRKTTPGLRVLERHAVRCGGGHNHRFSLSDAVMAKDNHLAVLVQQSGLSLTEALLAARAKLGHTTHFEVEVDRHDHARQLYARGPAHGGRDRRRSRDRGGQRRCPARHDRSHRRDRGRRHQRRCPDPRRPRARPGPRREDQSVIPGPGRE